MQEEQFKKPAQSADEPQSADAIRASPAVSIASIGGHNRIGHGRKEEDRIQTLRSPRSTVATRGSRPLSVDHPEVSDERYEASEEQECSQRSALPQAEVVSRASSAPPAPFTKTSDRIEQTPESERGDRTTSLTASDLAKVDSDNDYILFKYLGQSVEEEPWCIGRNRRDEFVRDCEQVRLCFGCTHYCSLMSLIRGRRGANHTSAMRPRSLS